MNMGNDRRRSVTVRAPGKINVYFRVGALQQDGYHDVASLYQAVSLYEEVTATESDSFSLRFAGPIDTTGLSTDDSNLATRAAKLLAAHTGYTGGAELAILKRVPIAGGMGGGSADAAATLVACDELWGTGVGRTGLHALAACSTGCSHSPTLGSAHPRCTACSISIATIIGTCLASNQRP